MSGIGLPRVTDESPATASGDWRRCLREAVALLARGDFDAAVKAASEACHEAPRRPETHYAYGQAWLGLQAPARAEQAFAAALQLSPGWADAWTNYGVARYQQGAIQDAKTAMRQALSRVPGHPAAISNLAAFMRITGEASAAEALLKQVIEKQPANAAARLNLVADLLQEERALEALDVLGEAPPQAADPRTLRHWHLQRSTALIQLRRTGETHRQLEAFAALGDCPPEFAVLWHWRLVLLASAENDEKRARREAMRTETALAAFGAQSTREHRIMAHFDLAKFWSSRRNAERAFRNWTQGHVLLKPSQPFSRERTASFIDANIALLDGARFASGPRSGNADPAPVFIVGMPRSGTTLCEQILAAHRDVHGAGERPDLSQAFATMGGASGEDDVEAVGRLASLDKPEFDRVARTYLDKLHALAPDKTRVVDKMPGNYLYLGLVGLLFPGAKIIHCVRDPRDIGLSIFTFRFHGYHPYAHDLADIGWMIAQQSRLMDHWKAALPNAILTVALADWVHDFEGTLARVLTHLELSPDPNCARFYESESRVWTVSRTQVREPVNDRGLGRWLDYAAQIAPLVTALREGGVDLG